MRTRPIRHFLATLALATALAVPMVATSAGAQSSGPVAPVPGGPSVAQGFRSAAVGWRCSTGWTPGCATKWAQVNFETYLAVTAVQVRFQEFTSSGPVWRITNASTSPAKTGWTVVVAPLDVSPQASWRQIEIRVSNPYFPGAPATRTLWVYF